MSQRIDHLTRAAIARLDRANFILWLCDGQFRVVYIEPGVLVLFDHRKPQPVKFLCNWKRGRRTAQAHALAIDDVLDKIRQMLEARMLNFADAGNPTLEEAS